MSDFDMSFVLANIFFVGAMLADTLGDGLVLFGCYIYWAYKAWKAV